MFWAALCSILSSILAYICIYTGYAFSNAKLLPSIFSSIYDVTNFWVRLLIITVTLSYLANAIFATLFKIYPATIVGPCMIVVSVAMMVTNAVILQGVHVNWQVIGASILACVSCALVSWLLVTSS